jgi:hypothetical protein
MKRRANDILEIKNLFGLMFKEHWMLMHEEPNMPKEIAFEQIAKRHEKDTDSIGAVVPSISGCFACECNNYLSQNLLGDINCGLCPVNWEKCKATVYSTTYGLSCCQFNWGDKVVIANTPLFTDDEYLQICDKFGIITYDVAEPEEKGGM